MKNLKDLVIATGNKNKFREYKEIISPLGIDVLPIWEFGDLAEPEETGNTFAENSMQKAIYYGNKINKPVISDDSGLCVNALKGQPGIYSARWAGKPKDFKKAMSKIHKLLKEDGTKDSTAFFACAIALYNPEKDFKKTFEGRVHGNIVDPRGEGGFGYDPIFMPKGFDKTFGEMLPDEKHKISHRSLAVEDLLSYLEDVY